MYNRKRPTIFECCVNSSLIERLPPWLPSYTDDIEQSYFTIVLEDPDLWGIVRNLSFTLRTPRLARYRVVKKYLARLFSENCRNKFTRWKKNTPVAYKSYPEFVCFGNVRNLLANKGRLPHSVSITNIDEALALDSVLFDVRYKIARDPIDVVNLHPRNLSINGVCFTIFADDPLHIHPVINVTTEIDRASFSPKNPRATMFFLKEPLNLKEVTLITSNIFAEGVEII